MNGADFALPIMNAPAVGARPDSADELATLGLDWHLRLAESSIYHGEAGFCVLEKPKKMLDHTGLLREVDVVVSHGHKWPQLAMKMGSTWTQYAADIRVLEQRSYSNGAIRARFVV
jgi:hypothetical protein